MGGKWRCRWHSEAELITFRESPSMMIIKPSPKPPCESNPDCFPDSDSGLGFYIYWYVGGRGRGRARKQGSKKVIPRILRVAGRSGGKTGQGRKASI